MNDLDDDTRLPSGKFSEYAWDGLSEPMRDVFRYVAEIGEERRMGAQVRTLNALASRGLVDYRSHTCQLTEGSKALVEWMKDKERNT